VVADVSYCNPRHAIEGEEEVGLRRTVTLGSAGSYTLEGTVTARDTNALDALAQSPGGILATATSRLVDGLPRRPGAAVDRDLGTGWVAGTSDFDPKLTLELPERRAVRGLQLLRDPLLAASGAKEVEVSLDSDEPRPLVVDDEGYVRFPAERAKRIDVTFKATRPMVDIDSSSGQRTFIPVGVSEVRVLGAETLRRPLSLDAETGAPCGFGPSVVVNGKALATEVTGRIRDLVRGGPLTWRLCESRDVELRAGANEVVAPASGQFVPDRLVLHSSAPGAVVEEPREQRLTRTGEATMAVRLAGVDQESVLAVPQNFNAGWEATDQQGRELRAVRVNGWMQGWVLPAGATAVDARFAADTAYRLALLVGAVLLAALAAAAVVTGRRRSVDSGIRPPAAAPPSRRGDTFCLAAGAALVAGFAGVVVSMLVVLAWVRSRRRRWMAVGLAAGLCVVAAAALVVLDPWPQGRANVASAAVQLLVVTGLLLGAGSVVGASAPRRALSVGVGSVASRRRPARMMGRSTR
jgi:arabinofuranan 3-O-arabinosyltransferase